MSGTASSGRKARSRWSKGQRSRLAQGRLLVECRHLSLCGHIGVWYRQVPKGDRQAAGRAGFSGNRTSRSSLPEGQWCLLLLEHHV